MASIGLPWSKASPPMLISQGQEESLQHFSFKGGLIIQTGTLLYVEQVYTNLIPPYLPVR